MITIKLWENPRFNPINPESAPRWMVNVEGCIRSADSIHDAIESALTDSGKLSTPSAIAET